MSLERLPVLVLSGFLGSGKTTLLNHLLSQQPRSAVLMNEFGKAGVDQRLVAEQAISLSLLAGGCVCCQLRDAFAPTLKNLWMDWRQQRGYDLLIIEASGIANPEPLLDTLLRERWLAPRLQLLGIVTTLAVPVALSQLQQFPEAKAQILWSDLVLLTQADLAHPQQITQLSARLDSLIPSIPRLSAPYGKVDWAQLQAVMGRPFRPFNPEPVVNPSDFHSHAFQWEIPCSWKVLEAGLQQLWQQYAPHIIRMKGLVFIEGEENPRVLQWAGGVCHPPTAIPARSSDQGLSRLVIITLGEAAGLDDFAKQVLPGL